MAEINKNLYKGKREKMKRILSGAVIFATVLVVFILGNTYVVDIALCLVALRCVYELSNAFEKKGYSAIRWVAYLACIVLGLVHIFPESSGLMIYELMLPISIVLCFGDLVFRKNKKRTAIDVAVTAFEILYIVMFLSVLSKIRTMENGKFFIWYVFIAAWVTDVFALYTGRTIGKHHFTEISPNKTLEGCVGGLIGAVIGMALYTVALNNILGLGVDYISIIAGAILLSAIGQIGDLAASSIKRYAGIKDFSNLIPGHGGMLDRIDSIIFIAPFAYILLNIIV